MRCHVFPGQGVQKKGMGSGLFPRFAELCSQADEVLGYSIEELCLTNPERRLSTTEYPQPAIYVVNALHHLAAREELPPADYFAGHSLGEYSALFAAGAFDFATGLALAKRRAEPMRVSGAFPSPWRGAAAADFRGCRAAGALAELATPVRATEARKPRKSDADAVREALVEQLTQP